MPPLTFTVDLYGTNEVPAEVFQCGKNLLVDHGDIKDICTCAHGRSLGLLSRRYVIDSVCRHSCLLAPVSRSQVAHLQGMKPFLKALALAFAMVMSLCLSITFGGRETDWNDWHYDVNMLSYGWSRDSPVAHFAGKTPAFFSSLEGRLARQNTAYQR